MTARPPTPWLSATARTAGSTTADAWVMDAACVSSKSSPCASVPLASAASGVGAVVLSPTTVQSPRASHAASAPRTAGATSWVEAASAMPSTSRVRRLTEAATGGGIRANVRSWAKVARRVASVIAATMIPRSRRATTSAGGRDAFRGRHRAAPDRSHQAPDTVVRLELLGEPGFDELLHERLALGSRGGQHRRAPAHDEVAAAHVRQPRLRALQLGERTVEGRHPRAGDERRRRIPGHARRCDTHAFGAEGRHALAQMEVAEAPAAQVLRQLLGRPRRNPHLLAERVHRLNGGDEVVVARDEHRRVVGAVGGVVDQVGDEPRVDPFLRRVLVLAATRDTPTGTADPRLTLDEVAGAQLETFEEAFDHRRCVGGDADVVVGAAEDRGGPADRLRDPGGESVVVDSQSVVVALQGTVEVLAVEENQDLHARLREIPEMRGMWVGQCPFPGSL